MVWLKTYTSLTILLYKNFHMQKSRVRQSKHSKVSELKVDFINAPGRTHEAANPVARKLKALLSEDLGFHNAPVNNGKHNFHSFPAKFPPELARVFIDNLTSPGEIVLDPMAGSATTVVETISAGRTGIGFDIDPLALLMGKVKVTPLDPLKLEREVRRVVEDAEVSLMRRSKIEKALENKFDEGTKEFVDYWFGYETQVELMALLLSIEKVENTDVKDFLKLAFSSIIVTKSGGVSLAWDLGHTRPHKLKQGKEKKYKPAIPEFEKRVLKNVAGIRQNPVAGRKKSIQWGNAESLPLENESVDLIVTSPPYASNAIDYMRAHKFSLVWLGMAVNHLTELRSTYIGSDKVTDFSFESLPPLPEKVISQLSRSDERKGMVLRRYYSEMKRVLGEIQRMLKPAKAAVLVVGSSVMRGIDTQTDRCLAEIGESLELPCVGIGVRSLDRDRRMMPTSSKARIDSQIEKRMHQEFVLGFLKPDTPQLIRPYPVSDRKVSQSHIYDLRSRRDTVGTKLSTKSHNV